MFHIHIPRKILALALVPAILVPTVAAAAPAAPTMMQQAIKAMQAADKVLGRDDNLLTGVNKGTERAIKLEAKANTLLDKAGVKDSRLDEAETSLKTAERSVDTAKQQVKHAEELLDAAIKQAQSQSGGNGKAQ